MDQPLVWIGLAVGGWIGWQMYLANRPTVNETLTCPHCGTRGQVSVERLSRKKGISGGKATGALMTGGASMFATGLSRKEAAQHLVCGNCGIGWDVA